MRGWRAKFAASAVLVLAASCMAAPNGPGPFVTQLNGPVAPIRLADLAKGSGAGDPRGAARIVLVWRSDCAPCVAELRYFDKLERAAGGERLVTVALEPGERARATLTSLSVKPHPAYAAVGDPEVFLERVSGGRRLPLAIAFDREGAICVRHVGLLGVERARAWSRRC